tara:strand:+ start:1452 stop:1877 length:426 start_codon:yes stop_codon:yes gene_type:complete
MSEYNNNGASILANPGKVYSDLDLRFDKHPTFNDVLPVTDIDAVKNSVKNLILTNTGERPFQPNVGSNIFASLFENANPYTMESIRNRVKDMITSSEPRVNSVRCQLQFNEAENECRVTIHFNITGVSNNESVDFYLERLR